MKVLVLLGSLRAASFTRKLGLAAESVAPDGMTFDYTDGGDVPLYNQDLDGDEKPAAVTVLLNQVSNADGLLFVTPEFNYGIPASLKNMIDWASRPAFKSPLKGKPSLVMAQSVAPSGGARVWAQLTSVLGGTLTPTHLAPSFTVGAAHEKFDESGALTDELTRVRLERTLAAFELWAKSLT
ncbi:NAD(P)H-dependent oxidoreductase [Myxococcota bacterium]|nr:NAD(P)H-dependent oxidoreductase [Myxococcota bacterium]